MFLMPLKAMFLALILALFLMPLKAMLLAMILELFLVPLLAPFLVPLLAPFLVPDATIIAVSLVICIIAAGSLMARLCRTCPYRRRMCAAS